MFLKIDLSENENNMTDHEIKDLAKYHQVIVITHQPIIAAKADKHFYVNTRLFGGTA